MTSLQRINYRPTDEDLSESEVEYLQRHFDAYGKEVVVDGESLSWEMIDEIEVVQAARMRGPSGWLVKNFVLGERYHVGIYFQRSELVLTNMTLDTAKYIVQTIAYYAPGPVNYKGPEGISPLTEI